MNTKELLTLMRKACDDMLATVEKKNADYTAEAADALANFKACELLNLCSAETGAMVRRLDKFMREISFIRKGEAGLQVKDESIEDTFLDDAAYALLTYAIVKERKALKADVRKSPPGTGYATAVNSVDKLPNPPDSPDLLRMAYVNTDMHVWIPEYRQWVRLDVRIDPKEIA